MMIIIPEIMLLEDQSRSLPSLFSLNGVTDRRELRVSERVSVHFQHFTGEYKPGYNQSISNRIE